MRVLRSGESTTTLGRRSPGLVRPFTRSAPFSLSVPDIKQRATPKFEPRVCVNDIIAKRKAPMSKAPG